MDVQIYENKANIDFTDLNSKLLDYDYYSVKKEEIGIFHINKLEDCIYHIVFYINDEYHTGSKFIGNVNSMPVNIYVNTFLSLNSNKLFIENIHANYNKLIIEFINKLVGLEFIKLEFGTHFYKTIVQRLSKSVIQLDYINDSDAIETVENKLDAIDILNMNTNKIQFVTFIPNLNEYDKVLVSIKNNGVISTTVTIPNKLIKLLNIVVEYIE
ncbi:hypothetical protein [Clostridium paridis]|uniref:Uncharacterized protein n=1 Tax=Clostridium paridis TaxID=2803863 RepID=A0A937FJY8_9CLOT|nr:hypothetical protein [Clostridium paridis]MBL4933932.1 hypothetical protein [Clostridium paridis]